MVSGYNTFPSLMHLAWCLIYVGPTSQVLSIVKIASIASNYVTHKSAGWNLIYNYHSYNSHDFIRSHSFIVNFEWSFFFSLFG